MGHADAAISAGTALHVEVAYCPRPGVIDLTALVLAEGATLGEALRASGVLVRHGLNAEGLRTGVWNKPRDENTVLRERDRVEVYRPLIVDPKEARRQRYKRHRENASRR